MIKAAYSYWEDYRKKINGGFKSKRDLAITLTLSVLESKKQFSSVEFYTNKFGQQLVEDFKIPFDKVHVCLDHFDGVLDPDFWAYIKIYVYALQTEPFIHIDNDVILWDKIPDNIIDSDLFFQNKEHLSTHKGYERLLKEAKCFPKVNYDVIREHPMWAYNCGVVGANNLNIIKLWKEVVDEYLFSSKNKPVWETITDKHSHNHLFEQYFISSIISLCSMSIDKVSTLLKDDFMKSATRDYRMTHMWGEAKRVPATIDRVRNRLFKDYPKYKDIYKQPQTHAEIFDDIYKNELWGQGQGSGGGSTPEITFDYRHYIQKLLLEADIKTVVDLGCGDWQFSYLIDWDNVNYLGIDCVKSLIDQNNSKYGAQNIKFEYKDISSGVDGYEGDLLIIKDVLIHWPNKDVKLFIDKLLQEKKFKYILITNANKKDQLLNKDIKAGEFHNLDLNIAPFNYNFKKVLDWYPEPKITYLIETRD